jgi:hypothetical protein
MNALQNGLRLGQNFMIPKSQNPVAHGFQTGSSFVIPILLFSMLATIGLDHQLGFEAREINDVRLNHQLASELEATESMRPQVMPQQTFSIRHLASQ